MTEMEKNRRIDALTEELGEFFETAQNDVTTKLSLHLMSEGNKAALKKTLTDEEKRINGLTELYTSRAKSIVDFDASKVIQKGKQGTRMLIRNALSDYTKKVQRVHRLERIMPLRDAIFKQTQEGIKNGIPVTYKNGRKVGYKEYMEMNVRTTLQQNIGEKQLELGSQANVVFYLCNTYADCADDHADYQGKIYYDERYKVFSLKSDIQNEIEKHIRKTDMISVQDVKSEAPYLTTRPNCRHTLTPISIDQALNIDTKTLLQDLKLARGSYKPKNYKDMQEQRYNERMVRKYKTRSSINQELLAQDPNNELLKRQIALDNTRVRQYQGKLRELVKSNPVLERDYRKETREILLKDLGAKYNLSKVPKVVDVPQTPPQLTVKFGDMPAIWSNFKGKTKVGFEKTWVKYTERIETVEKQYGYDEQREKIAAFYKRYDKLFPTSKIVLAKEGGEHYNPNDNAVNIRFLDSDTKSENSVMTTVIHEFGHAIDRNITTKILKGDRIAISQGMWREEQDMIDSYAHFKRKVSATALQDAINPKIQKIRDRVAGYNEDQKRLYNASNEFSYAVQEEIKKGLDNARKTELYGKVREFDNMRSKIRVMHEEHPDWEESNNSLKQVSREIITIKGYESASQRIKDANISQSELAYEKRSIKGLENEFGKLGIDMNNLDEEKKKREATFLERKNKVDNIIESYIEKKEAAKKEYEEKFYYTQASDFLDAISLGRFQTNFELRYGHGTKYYKKNKGQSEVEIFTHLSTTSVSDPDVYKMIKNEFPKIVGKFEELINTSYELMEDEINGKV